MFFSVRPDDPLPIYDQIVRQVKFAIARKSLLAGERLPSVRELAKDLQVNPNTVVRAFQLLQQESLIEPQRGVGFLVAAGAVRECQRQRRELVRSRLEATLREAREAGLTDEELDKLFRQSLQAIPVAEVES